MKLLWAAAASVMISACSSMPPSPYSDDPKAFAGVPDLDDRRGRFREIFCAILEARGASLPDARPCEAALTRVGPEPAGTGEAVELGQSNGRLVAAIVSGVGWDCISNWLDAEGSAASHIRQFGYDAFVVEVDSLSGTAANALQIRDAIMAEESDGTEPHLVLIGYSKGAPDILEAIVNHPKIRDRIAAVVGAAGAVGGSPLADDVNQSKLDLLRHWPGAECSPGDGGAIDSLRPATRRTWLADNPLPGDFRYYTLATCPEPQRISPVLKSTYKKLSRLDARNDGMVLLPDQIIPGSMFLGCVNADHWAVSVPVARTHPNVASLFVDENDYPREALLEAVLRFVEGDLGR